MENKKLLLIAVIILLVGLGLCGLGLTGVLGVGAARLALRPISTLTATPTLTTIATLEMTVVPKPRTLHPRALTATAAALITETVGITSTLPILPTEIGLYPGVLETQPAEALETPVGTVEALETPGGPTETLPPLLQDSWCVPWNTPSTKAQVVKVIDGVTIEVTINGENYQVRYIGIDMPDYSADAGVWSQATEQNKKLVEGKTVLLIQDKSGADESGSLPRYVIVGGTFVNRTLLETGYAVASSIPPNTSCDSSFKEVEAQAKVLLKGLWAPVPTPTRTMPPPTATTAVTGAMVITRVSPKGTAWEQPEEYVEIRNEATYPIQLQGWSLRDNQNHVFLFPKIVLGSGQYCRVYTNQLHPSSCGFTYHSLSPIWDDQGDCAYLKDSMGILISRFCYE